jgi:hypothetical protein
MHACMHALQAIERSTAGESLAGDTASAQAHASEHPWPYNVHAHLQPMRTTKQGQNAIREPPAAIRITRPTEGQERTNAESRCRQPGTPTSSSDTTTTDTANHINKKQRTNKQNQMKDHNITKPQHHKAHSCSRKHRRLCLASRLGIATIDTKSTRTTSIPNMRPSIVFNNSHTCVHILAATTPPQQQSSMPARTASERRAKHQRSSIDFDQSRTVTQIDRGHGH